MKSAEFGQMMGRHGLTVPDIEMVMGVSRRTVFYWLSGNPIPMSVQLLAKAFDEGLIPLDWLSANLEAAQADAEPPAAS